MFVFYNNDINDIVKSRDHVDRIVIIVGIFEFFIRGCDMFIFRRFTLLMAHEGILKGCMVLIFTEIVYFNGPVIDQFLDSPLKGVVVVGKMPTISMVGTQMFVTPP